MPITINQCATCRSNPKFTTGKHGDVFLSCSNKGCFVGKKISEHNHDRAVALWNELNPTDAEILIPKPRENDEIRVLAFLGMLLITAVMFFKLGEIPIWLSAFAVCVMLCWSAHRHDMRVEYPRTVKVHEYGPEVGSYD